MVTTMEGVNLKISRAHEHLAVLDAKVESYIADCVVGGEFEKDTSEYVFCVSGDPPPLLWGVTVGEFAHNLRSALDNLLWALIEARGKKPSKANQFPIYEDLVVKKWKGKQQVGVPAEQLVAQLTQGVRRDDRTFIEKAQPYHDGPVLTKRHPLALLGELNNMDKHRFIAPLFAGVGMRAIGLPDFPMFEGLHDFLVREASPLPVRYDANAMAWPEAVSDVAEIREVTWVTGSSDDRTEIMRVKITPGGPKPKMKMQPEKAFSISLSHPERPMFISDFWRIYRRVIEIRDRFAGIIPA